MSTSFDEYNEKCTQLENKYKDLIDSMYTSSTH